MGRKKMNYFLTILSEGETVVSVTDRVITTRDFKGDYYAVWYHFDRKGVPVVEDKSLMITSGDDNIKSKCYNAVGSEDLPF